MMFQNYEHANNSLKLNIAYISFKNHMAQIMLINFSLQ